MTTHCSNCAKHIVYCVCCRHCGATPDACTCANAHTPTKIADDANTFVKRLMLPTCA